jgi:hypothetical protein
MTQHSVNGNCFLVREGKCTCYVTEGRRERFKFQIKLLINVLNVFMRKRWKILKIPWFFEKWQNLFVDFISPTDECNTENKIWSFSQKKKLSWAFTIEQAITENKRLKLSKRQRKQNLAFNFKIKDNWSCKRSRLDRHLNQNTLWNFSWNWSCNWNYFRSFI